MHIFQPYPVNEFEFDPFTISGKTGHCITAEADGVLNTSVSSQVAFGKLWEKNVVFVFIRDQRLTRELVDKSEFFSITFFKEEHLLALKYMKSVSGRLENKIEKAGMHVNKKLDIPFIDEGHLVFLVNKIASIPMTDDAFISKMVMKKYYDGGHYHQIIIGEIMEILAR